MSDQQSTLTRKQIRELFRRHRGAVQRTADLAGVSHPMVSQWLRGKTKSANVAGKAQLVASELLALEAEAGARQ
jgi:predicted transcriptional regulator